jgi:HD-GYP domain-containing protein (c-di-GMP phosphodiesterase class II)
LSKIVLTTISGGSMELGDIPFNLYAKGNTGGMVLFCRSGFAITQRHMEALRRSDRVFYISSADVDNYLDYAFDRIEKIVGSETIPAGEKARIVRGVGKRLVRKLLDDPRSGETVDHSGRFVDSQIELVLGSPDAAVHLFALSSADPYSLSHSINVSTFCILLGQQLLGDSREELRQLGLGGLLHDIGKTQLDARMLTMRTPLTEDEFKEIRRHPGLSAELMDLHKLPRPILAIGRSHHEMCDGSGFPEGLRGDSIHPFARIAAVANAYDGMTSDHNQRTHMPHLQALSIMAQKIKRYDSKVYHALLRIVLRDDRLIEGFLSRRIKPHDLEAATRHINAGLASQKAAF